MRPRKRIAVLGATELEASTLAIVLEARGYRVDICMSEESAMRIETPAAFLVLGMSNAQRERVRSRLRLQHRGCGFAMESHGADIAGMAWVGEMIEAVRMAVSARRDAKHLVAKASAAGELARAARNRRRVA